MKRKLILTLVMVVALACALAMLTGAASTTGSIDYNETVTLTDGTVLPIYDENQNPLIWFISGTETVTVDGTETTKNIYSSIIATQTTADENGNVVSYEGSNGSYKDAYGTTHPYFNCKGIKITYKLGENEDGTPNMLKVISVNGDNNHNNLVVVANFRGVNENIGDIQGGAFRSNTQYMFLPETMIRSGDWRQTYCKIVDLTQCVNLRNVINQSFKVGGNSITEVRFPTITPVYDEEGALTNPLVVDTFAFQGCDKITSLTMPETLYSVGNNAFQNCKKLTTLGNVPNLTTISNDAFENCYVLTGLDFKNTKLTSIGARAFRYAGLQDCIEFPSTLTTIGERAFYQLKLTKTIVFAPDAQIEHIGEYVFFQAKTVKAFSLSENVKTFGTNPFEGCEALEVMYLPDSLTQLPLFEKRTMLYFVNDPFTVEWSSGMFDSADWNGQKPAKPAVYYMPSSLTTVNLRALHSCTSINDTVVFPSGVTEIAGEYTFFAIENKNFVFLGNVTLLNVNSTKKSNYYFISADVTSESLTVQGNGSHNIYYHTGNSIGHIAEKTNELAPTCTQNGGTVGICFCAQNMTPVYVEGTALGHEFNLANGASVTNIIYANGFLNEGCKEITCARCDEVNTETKVEPIIIFNGYAADRNLTRITAGYVTNVNEYNEYAQFNEISYGVVAYLPMENEISSAPLYVGQDGVMLNDPDYTIHASIDPINGFDFIVSGFSAEHASLLISMCAYVYDGEKISYLCYDENGVYGEYNVAYAISMSSDKVGTK